MLCPTGALAHHQFCVLSQGLRHKAEIAYDGEEKDRFTLPKEFEPYLPRMREYWLGESPELRDFDSIVHLKQAVTVEGAIELWCVPTTYFQFLFSNYSLDVPILGEHYLEDHTLRDLYEAGKFGKFDWGPGGRGMTYHFPQFGNSVGITITVTTDDEQMIVARRSQTAKGIARDKGNWLCAVGTQIKRHQPRFLDADGVPTPQLSASEGLKDEMGNEIAAGCSELVCRGLVYRDDFHHCELLYETCSALASDQLLKAWRDTHVPDRREFAEVTSVDISRPELFLTHLSDRQNPWSPQHAAGALHTLARRFPKAVAEAGLPVSWSMASV